MKAFVPLFFLVLMFGSPALGAEPRIGVELNKLEAEGGSCQAYLVLENGTEDAFDRLVLDLVMFDPDGIIARRLAVDLAPLAAGKLAVKVFSVPDLACASIGRVLVNGVLGCEAGGASHEDCLSLVETTSRVDVDLIN
ncbi:MAG: Tat pathway signal sequence domain protein [Pseudomonadota bacterium]